MKAKEKIRKIAGNRWARTAALALTAAIAFSWLYSHGISPVWTAVAIVCFRGLFRFLYRIACMLVALAIILCILSFWDGTGQQIQTCMTTGVTAFGCPVFLFPTAIFFRQQFPQRDIPASSLQK